MPDALDIIARHGPAPDADDVASCARCGWRVTGVGARVDGAARAKACGVGFWDCKAIIRFGWAVRVDATERPAVRRAA